jgi:hypothetical protein
MGPPVDCGSDHHRWPGDNESCASPGGEKPGACSRKPASTSPWVSSSCCCDVPGGHSRPRSASFCRFAITQRGSNRPRWKQTPGATVLHLTAAARASLVIPARASRSRTFWQQGSARGERHAALV